MPSFGQNLRINVKQATATVVDVQSSCSHPQAVREGHTLMSLCLSIVRRIILPFLPQAQEGRSSTKLRPSQRQGPIHTLKVKSIPDMASHRQNLNTRRFHNLQWVSFNITLLHVEPGCHIWGGKQGYCPFKVRLNTGRYLDNYYLIPVEESESQDLFYPLRENLYY
jgi:hypothetical protein